MSTTFVCATTTAAERRVAADEAGASGGASLPNSVFGGLREGVGVTDSASRGQPLPISIWCFVGAKVVGILWNTAFLALTLLWATPMIAAEKRQDLMASLMAELVAPAIEIAATIVGLYLLFRRHRAVRRFWIIFLVVYCATYAFDVVVGAEPAGALFFTLTGAAWLLYWLLAKGPRLLPLHLQHV